MFQTDSRIIIGYYNIFVFNYTLYLRISCDHILNLRILGTRSSRRHLYHTGHIISTGNFHYLEKYKRLKHYISFNVV